jgi:hypothetical protein
MDIRKRIYKGFRKAELRKIFRKDNVENAVKIARMNSPTIKL